MLIRWVNNYFYFYELLLQIEQFLMIVERNYAIVIATAQYLA